MDKKNNWLAVKLLAIVALLVIVLVEIIVLRERPSAAEVSAIAAIAGATAFLERVNRKDK